MAFKVTRTEIPPALAVPRNDESIILKLLAYFDIFHYPLTKTEIRKSLTKQVSDAVLDEMLRGLLGRQLIFLHLGFYSIHNSPILAHRRTEGNARAERMLPKAKAIGRFLFCFPFVRAVAISGSLSKNFADEKADVDFFVITKSNRLWIARTIMHLFKKLSFVTGHQHYFCMNYYIDEEAMLIESQNIYTGIEIATLVPVSGKKTMDRFLLINQWSDQYFPGRPDQFLQKDQGGQQWIKQFTEWIFDNPVGERIDNWLFKKTTRRWQQKSSSGKLNKKGHTMNLVTGKHFSRSNPGEFQEKVLALYEQKLSDLKLI